MAEKSRISVVLNLTKVSLLHAPYVFTSCKYLNFSIFGPYLFCPFHIDCKTCQLPVSVSRVGDSEILGSVKNRFDLG